MLRPFFSFTCDSERDFVEVVIAGFFTVADVEAFAAARAEAFARLRCAPNTHLTLGDVSGARIQTQEVVAAFAQVVRDPRFVSRKMALIVGSSLTRIQALRAADRAGVRLFRTRADAEAWLFANEMRPPLSSAA